MSRCRCAPGPPTRIFGPTRDIVGLYLNPPDRALVLCVDEKPSIPAREPTAPILPLRPGQVERRTHDYIRHGTTDLFAALDIQSGKVIGVTRNGTGPDRLRPRRAKGPNCSSMVVAR